jgi:hypothetical protein
VEFIGFSFGHNTLNNAKLMVEKFRFFCCCCPVACVGNEQAMKIFVTKSLSCMPTYSMFVDVVIDLASFAINLLSTYGQLVCGFFESIG